MTGRIVALVDADLKKKAQIFGIENGMNLTEIIEKALEDFLKRNNRKDQG